jgi:hypothetical protein
VTGTLLQPTPYPKINASLNRLLQEVRAVLGDHFVGLYLHGSLAAGGFVPGRSDVDFVVAVQEPPTDSEFDALAEMHARLAADGLSWRAEGWSTHVEGSYIPLDGLRRHDPANMTFPALRVDGSFGRDDHGGEWMIQRHILREHGLVLAGPPPAELVDPVSADDLRRGTRGVLLEWWAPMDPDYVREPEYQAYAVLTMCRVLYTLENGEVVPKDTAARWAISILDPLWEEMIGWAMNWPNREPSDNLQETLAFIRFTVAKVTG